LNYCFICKYKALNTHINNNPGKKFRLLFFLYSIFPLRSIHYLIGITFSGSFNIKNLKLNLLFIVKYAFMKNKILIIFAHPRFEKSMNNQLLVRHIPDIPGITFNDLYEKYADFNIDLESEKKLLAEHNIIVFQHPFYWYSAPPLLKQWIDIVLEFGWAYGPGGDALTDKITFCAITTGGNRTAYNNDGHNRFTINELLAPVNQTAHLCKMIYLPPFVVHGTHRITGDELTEVAQSYGKLLRILADGDFEPGEIKKYQYLNEWLTAKIN